MAERGLVKRISRVAVCVAAMQGVIGCGNRDSGPTPTVAAEQRGMPGIEAHFEARRRLIRAFMEIELHWVFRGEYPQDALTLIGKKPVEGLGATPAEVFVDPYSLEGLPLRYRLDEELGPQLASIGPDRHWGGWDPEYVSFYGFDDLKIDRTTASAMVDLYVHDTYFLAVERGEITRLPVPERRYDEARTWGQAGEATRITTCAELLEYLEEQRGVTVPFRRRLPQGPEDVGFASWAPVRPALDRPSLYDAVSILDEAMPEGVYLEWDFDPPFLFAYGDIDALERTPWRSAFSTVLDRSEGRYANLGLLGHDTALATAIILPEGWFDAGSLSRLADACVRICRGKDPMVYKTSAGVCITEFPSNCARFLFLERFPGLTPSHETYIQIKPEIKRQGGWEFWY